ncbi:RNA polymerase I-specific transcription initiation factor RRN3 [Powellomyces hirtus]|nr:RNA polymerase I-specific transcription initiation factor RRN3 [Powellomyces hirtus]
MVSAVTAVPLDMHAATPQLPSGKQTKTVRFDMPASPAAKSDYQLLLSGTLEDSNVILTFLVQAMKRKMEGDSSLYNDILHLLSRKSPLPTIPAPLLIHWLHAFSQIVSSFTPAFNALVNAIIHVNWWNVEDDGTLLVYKRFLENLVSAHAVHVMPVATMLVTRLRQAHNNGIAPSLHFDRVHTILQSVLALIPTGPSFLLPVLTENFPHKRETLDVHVFYLRNVLRMLDYAPVLRDPVLALIVDRIVQIDVEIQVELEDLEDDIWDQVQQTVDLTDLSNPDSLWKNARSRSPEADVNGDLEEDDLTFDSDDEEGIVPIAVDFREVVEKLDAMLRIVFQYIRDFATCNPGDPLRVLFDVMLHIFERTVLPTHKLRCGQFLWFYMCSLDPSFPELFMGLLVGKLFDVSAPSVIRISAASYLGSFIARARFLSLTSVRTCLKLLHGWTYSYVENNDTVFRGQAPDLERYGVFYSAVQAILYVFCFRWRQLMIGEGSATRYGMLPPELKDFQRVLLSRFAPLRICSQSIVTEFTKRTHSLDILYLHSRTISQPSTTNNNYLTVPNSYTTASSSLAFNPNNIHRLDPFFPFDPITLPVSRAYIDPIYQPWESEPTSDDEDDTDDELEAISTSFDGVRL